MSKDFKSGMNYPAKMSEQPTDEQIKEFWEWCGFKQIERDRVKFSLGSGDIYRLVWIHPTGLYEEDNLPPIDLNNLFKYAVQPNEYITEVSFVKGECQIATRGLNNKGVQYFVGRDEDPALALFWAIWEVIKND